MLFLWMLQVKYEFREWRKECWTYILHKIDLCENGSEPNKYLRLEPIQPTELLNKSLNC